MQALKAGLRAVRLLGVVGVVLEVYWGAVEHDNPQEYDWAAYKEVMQLVRDEGLTLQVGGEPCLLWPVVALASRLKSICTRLLQAAQLFARIGCALNSPTGTSAMSAFHNNFWCS